MLASVWFPLSDYRFLTFSSCIFASVGRPTLAWHQGDFGPGSRPSGPGLNRGWISCRRVQLTSRPSEWLSPMRSRRHRSGSGCRMVTLIPRPSHHGFGAGPEAGESSKSLPLVASTCATRHACTIEISDKSLHRSGRDGLPPTPRPSMRSRGEILAIAAHTVDLCFIGQLPGLEVPLRYCRVAAVRLQLIRMTCEIPELFPPR